MSYRRGPAAFALFCMLAAGDMSHGQEPFGVMRKSVMEQVETLETESLFKQAELANKYVAALDALEKRIAATGDLDAVMHVREEKGAVQKDGTTTSHQDKPLVELRGKYDAASKAISDERSAARGRIAAELARKIKDQEAALTKAGSVDAAIALRKDGEALLLELSAGGSSDLVEASADPRETSGPDLAPLKAITIPDDKPPLKDAPFSIKGRWLENMTVPVMKQRVSGWTILGDRGGPKAWITVVVPPGTVWSGSQGAGFELSAGKVIATRAKFADLSLVGDLACNYYFLNCDFTNCGFNKGGVWYGWDQATKFYFENCIIRKRFNQSMNFTDLGFRAQTSVFEDVEFPSFDFRKKEPADQVNHTWLRISNCRFTGCQIPLSVLLLTRDCIFENCTFVPDGDKVNTEPLKKPVEVVIYQNNCRNRIQKLPENVKLTLKPDTDWKGGAIPTAASLLSLMAAP